MFQKSHARRLAATLAALTLVAFARVSTAETAPPIPGAHDTTAIGYIQHVTIGTPACATCPPRVCPGEPVQVTISGELPSPCVEFRGFSELPVAAPFTVLQADFVVDTCGVACPAVTVPFSATVSLPGTFNTSGMFVLRHQVRTCPDTTVVDTVESRQYTYAIEPNCAVRPPLDSLVRSFVTFEVTPARRCPGDTLSLVMKTTGCYPCLRLQSLTFDSASTYRAVMSWRPLCPELGCGPQAISAPLGAFLPGSHVVRVDVDVNILRAPEPDSVISYSKLVPFEVPISCNGAPCVEGSLPARLSDVPVCAATIPRGGTETLVLNTRTGVDIWGAEGSLGEYFPLQILDVRYAGAAPGTFVSWNRDGQRVRFIAFTIGGQPVVPVGTHDFLRVTVRIDPTAPPETEATWLSGGIELAAGRDGERLPHCIVTARLAPPSLRICIGTRPDSCDANGDGRADVRDLVRMVSCLMADSAGTDTTRVCQDCNSDGRFDLSDLFCCARHILRASPIPPESLQASGDVRVAFGTLRRDGGNWFVPVRVLGARDLAGTLLRLRYPAERWRADVPGELAQGVGGAANEGWMPLVDIAQPGVVGLGWLKLGEGVASELSFEFVLRPLADALPGDELAVEGADLVLQDGTTLRPAEALPVVSLISPLDPPPSAPASLQLGPARPNPFTGTTHFSVSLPRESMIELTVHDVAGRTVATLARGRFVAGVREFEWNGAGAAEGVYFARLTVDGRMLSQRVALLRGR